MIEFVSKDNLTEVLPLIRGYQTFYQVDDVCDQRNQAFFSQFDESSELGCQLAYRLDGQLIGFATVYFSFSSTIAQKVAVLNDLYVLPEHRGKGIAKKLINAAADHAKRHQAYRLQWVTALDNEPAKKLYDSLGAKQSTWHFYIL